MKPSEPIEISVVVPVYNEEGNLPVLIPHLVKVLKSLGLSYEMIFVDDGSSDGSRKILKEMASQYPSLRILCFKENRGLSTALWAVLRETRGERIATLDSDLQNDPADIPKLLEYLDRFDMATGWRQKREDSWLEKISSKIGNAVRNWLSGENIHDSACTLRAFKKECIRDIPVFDGCIDFFPPSSRGRGIGSLESPFPTIRGSSASPNTILVIAWCDLSSICWQ